MLLLFYISRSRDLLLCKAFAEIYISEIKHISKE